MSGALQHPLIGAIDRIETGRSSALVRGWCLDLRSKAPPAELRLLHRGAEIGRVAGYFRRRDVARLGLKESECGFYLELDAAIDVSHLDEVVLTDMAGERVHLFTRPNKTDVLSPLGEIESVSGAEVVGWLFEPESDSESPPYIMIGNTRFAIAPDLERPDLVQRGASPRTRVGFTVDITSVHLQPDAMAPRRIELWSGLQIVASVGLDGERPLGILESGSANGVSGWAIVAGEPDRVASVEVLIDGQHFAYLPADQKRSDLRSRALSLQGGGFSMSWGSSPVGRRSFNIAVRHLETGIELRGSPIAITDAALGSTHFRDVVLGNQGPTVIIARRDPRDSLARCIESITRNTTLAIDILVLDEAQVSVVSEGVVKALAGKAGVEIHQVRSWRDEGRVLNAAVRSVPGDVILIDASVQVGPRWIEHLLIAAAQHARTGSVSAISGASVALSARGRERSCVPPQGWSVDDAARAAAQCARPFWPVVGVGEASCVFIRRDCFDALGGFDEATGLHGPALFHAFNLRAMRFGWQNVLDERTYVTDSGTLSAKPRAGALVDFPEYTPALDSFRKRADLNAVRFLIRKAFAVSAGRPRPRILFVISTRSGGTPQTNRDLMRAISGLYEPYLLVCSGEVLTLYAGNEEEIELERYALERSIDPVLHNSDEYDEVVKNWLVRYAIELVHIRHLAWHSLGLPQACRELALPVVYSFHDFYMICPSIKLIDENMKHCGGVCTPSSGACLSELWSDPRMPPLKHKYVHQWRARSLRALEGCDAFVTTSRSAVETIMRAFPRLSDRMWIIPHGRTFERFGRAAVSPTANRPFRILVAGGLSRAKGSALVSAVARELQGEGVEFHLLGSADDGIDRDLVVMHGTYDRADFIAKASAIGPAIGLVPSLWSETYCHVLTEMWASGLPVLAYDIGAVGERIRQNGGGWLFDRADADLACEAIRIIRRDLEDYDERLAEVHAWQMGEGSSLTDAAMGQAYMDLYARIFESRRTFTG